MIVREEDMELALLAEKWLKERVAPVCNDYDEKHEFPQDIYNEMISLGFNAIAVPEEYGGIGLNTVQQILVAEAFGKYELGLGSAMGVNSSNAELVLLAGTEEQKRYFMKKTLEGFTGVCLTEPNAGSDPASMRTTADFDESTQEWIINGTKCFITNGAIANCFCVFAVTQKGAGVKGISCFLVDRDTEGLSIGKNENKMGIRLSVTSEIIFDNVKIPRDNLLGELNKGFMLAMATLDCSRLEVGAMGVGLAMRCLDEAVKYSKERVQFGRPIAALGVIQSKIADMGMDVESTHQLVLHAAELMDAKLPFGWHTCMAKCRGADIANHCVTEALQIFGGYGYMKEYPLEKMYRDAKILQIYEGTCEVQRQVIAGTYLR